MAISNLSLDVLELYCGLGGMHAGFAASKFDGQVNAAFDINDMVLQIYKHNYPDSKVYNRNIQWLNPKRISQMNVNAWLMSPPCQPFTRAGHQKGIDDPRCDSLLHLLQLLPQLDTPPKLILLENVAGFETSLARQRVITTLTQLDYRWQEFWLSPDQFGIPNSRLRYFLVALAKETVPAHSDPLLWTGRLLYHVPGCNGHFETDYDTHLTLNAPYTYPPQQREKPVHRPWQRQAVQCLGEYLSPGPHDDVAIPSKVVCRWGQLLDVVTPTSTRSLCFTKGYGHKVEGTGSVVQQSTLTKVEHKQHLQNHSHAECLAARTAESASETRQCPLSSTLGLRYFHADEMFRLHGFPDSFAAPAAVTAKQVRRGVGNSLNVTVVTALLDWAYGVMQAKQQTQ
eukprot:m.170566 g.170566  ORF g.170566 m.170566 type:complete len:398 (+) comp16692_c0_seq1:1509-2702(+)